MIGWVPPACCVVAKREGSVMHLAGAAVPVSLAESLSDRGVAIQGPWPAVAAIPALPAVPAIMGSLPGSLGGSAGQQSAGQSSSGLAQGTSSASKWRRLAVSGSSPAYRAMAAIATSG